MLRRSSCSSGGDKLLRCRKRKREWRNWANLPSELTEEIASRLLGYDVTEYLRFRAACKAWRMCTEVPRSLESRFRPRRWIMLSNCDGVRRRFLNLATGACAHVDLPELSGHHVESSTEGLLVLRDKGSNAIRLLDPFTRSLVELPPATMALRSVGPPWRRGVVAHQDLATIKTACISDETSPPSVALFLLGYLSNIAYAKPGDERWSLVDENGWERCPSDRRLLHEEDALILSSVWCNSAVTLRGRIYFSTLQGNVLMLRLHPRPLLVPVIMDDSIYDCAGNMSSYLIHADDEDGESQLLMVRFHDSLRHILPGVQRLIKRWKDTGLFKLRSEARRGRRYDWYDLEVFEVDVEEKTLVHADDSIGQRAVFIGEVACVSLSPRVFPSLYGDAVYFGVNSCCSTPVGVCRLNDGSLRAEPRLQLVPENGGQAPFKYKLFGRMVPGARPCSLEEYLVGYVSCKDGIKD